MKDFHKDFSLISVKVCGNMLQSEENEIIWNLI